MADVQYDKLQLVGFREPDYTTEENPDKTKYNVELPGTYRVGFMLGDTFMELYGFKAGNIMEQIAQVQSGQQEPSQQSEQSSSGDSSGQSGEQAQQ